MSDIAQMLCKTEEISANSWGMFSYGDGPMSCCGCGIGSFGWFNSKSDMFRFLVSEEIIGEDADISGITNKILSDEISLDDGIRQINQELEGIIQVSWIGQFQNLCNGADDYAKEVISNFRQIDFIEHKFKPIDESEVSSFKEFLETYGF